MSRIRRKKLLAKIAACKMLIAGVKNENKWLPKDEQKSTYGYELIMADYTRQLKKIIF